MKFIIAAVSGIATVGLLWVFFRPPFGENIVHLNTQQRIVALTYDGHRHTSAWELSPRSASSTTFALNSGMKVLVFVSPSDAPFNESIIVSSSWFRGWPEFPVAGQSQETIHSQQSLASRNSPQKDIRNNIGVSTVEKTFNEVIIKHYPSYQSIQ